MTSMVIVSDLHAGSVYGLMPPRVFREEGNSITQNDAQKRLYKFWKIMCDEWGGADHVVVNGDSIDGVQPAAYGREVWSTDLNEQIEAATVLLKMIKGKNYRFTIGSGYHVESPGFKSEQILAQNFGTKAKMQLHLTMGSQNIHFSHQIGVSTTVYRATAIARELAMNLFNLKALNDYNWVFRSHAHYYVQVSYKTHTGIVTPCWQLQTPYMERKAPFGMIPDIGALRLDDEHGDYLTLSKMIWRQERPKLEKLNSV